MPSDAAMPLRQALARSLAEDGCAVRAVPFTDVTFEAFRISDGRTYAIGEVGGRSLDEAMNDALTRHFDHKDHLLIRETNRRGSKLHVYAIRRRSAPAYVWRDHVQVREHRLYPALVCTVDGGVL